MKNYAAVFFDLDGTIADTAPDLNFALNEMLRARGLNPIAEKKTRMMTSSGAKGLITQGFEADPTSQEFNDLRIEFLEIYENNLMRSSRLFEGVDFLLCKIEKKHIPWGIVTNKAHRYTMPVLKGLNISDRAACVVSGDTTPNPKPHPDPLLEAAKLIGVSSSECIYVGDDQRDIQAAKAAKMDSVAALYGYLGVNAAPETWGATKLINEPIDLLPLLGIFR